MTTAANDTTQTRAYGALSAEMRDRIVQMSQGDARQALAIALADLERQAAARQQAEEERNAVQEQLQALEEAALNAGGVGVVQERRDNRLIVTIGRSEAVVGIADASVDYLVGDRVRTDMGRAIAMENLGGGESRACDVAQFVSIYEENRALIKANGKERVCALAHTLRNGKRELLKPGASVIVDDEAGIIYGVYSSPESRDYADEIPDVVFVSNEHLDLIEKDIILPLLAGPEKRKAGACFILSGPAGGGKTHLLLAACQKQGVKLIRVTGDTVSSGIISETGRAIADVFDRAIEQARNGSPTIVAIEEANVLVSRRYGYDHRSAASQEFANISSSVILALDKLVHLGPAFPVEVVLTSNASSEIEPAVRSRSTERRLGFIDRDFGSAVLRAHLRAGDVDFAGGDADVERLIDVLFELDTPTIQVDAEIGQTREKFKLFPGQLMLPRLVSGLAEDLKVLDQPVPWEAAARVAHSRLRSHAEQVADSPEHYIIYCEHPFSGDPDLRIRRAVSVYPAEMPRDLLL